MPKVTKQQHKFTQVIYGHMEERNVFRNLNGGIVVQMLDEMTDMDRSNYSFAWKAWCATARTILTNRLQPGCSQSGKVQLGSCLPETFYMLELDGQSMKDTSSRTVQRDGTQLVLPMMIYRYNGTCSMPQLNDSRWTMKHYRTVANCGTHSEIYYYRMRYVRLNIFYNFDNGIVDCNFVYIHENWDPEAQQWKVC
jgi:hypothetical protein